MTRCPSTPATARQEKDVDGLPHRAHNIVDHPGFGPGQHEGVRRTAGLAARPRGRQGELVDEERRGQVEQGVQQHPGAEERLVGPCLQPSRRERQHEIDEHQLDGPDEHAADAVGQARRPTRPTPWGPRSHRQSRAASQNGRHAAAISRTGRRPIGAAMTSTCPATTSQRWSAENGLEAATTAAVTHRASATADTTARVPADACRPLADGSLSSVRSIVSAPCSPPFERLMSRQVLASLLTRFDQYSYAKGRAHRMNGGFGPGHPRMEPYVICRTQGGLGAVTSPPHPRRHPRAPKLNSRPFN